MAILLPDPDAGFRAVWHDADLHFMHIFWAADGTVSIRLRCEINPEEDFDVLREIGIMEKTVGLEFRDVLHLRSNIRGYYSRVETIMTWSVISPSPLLDALSSFLKVDMSEVGVQHHQFESLGSTIDIVSREVWIEDVPQSEL
jgi:hypothetical protein